MIIQAFTAGMNERIKRLVQLHKLVRESGEGVLGRVRPGSAYGFLQGAWPFGLVEPVWAIAALRRRCWRVRSNQTAKSVTLLHALTNRLRYPDDAFAGY